MAMVAGVVASMLVIAALVGVGAWCCCCRRRDGKLGSVKKDILANAKTMSLSGGGWNPNDNHPKSNGTSHHPNNKLGMMKMMEDTTRATTRESTEGTTQTHTHLSRDSKSTGGAGAPPPADAPMIARKPSTHTTAGGYESDHALEQEGGRLDGTMTTLWQQYTDDASGQAYWYNHRTGESTWEDPEELQ